MIKYLLMAIFSISLLFTGCKSCNPQCQLPGRDPDVIENEDHYIPWWSYN